MNSSLSFKFIANACGVFQGSKGTRILCDPWLNDGVFDGSWCHFPKLNTRNEDVQDVDAIYISHLHPDHFDERYFQFKKSMPIVVLDHEPNYLIRNLLKLGYSNLVRIRDGETVAFREFNLTMFAPFAKHCFFDAEVGNLIDSALLVECNGITALNTNDNTPTIKACETLRERFGTIDLAMLNYNAAGPYPSCFENLSKIEKLSEHKRILKRNFEFMRDLLVALKPRAALPFAGAYVLGGDLCYKNPYLGTTTWDECAAYLNEQNLEPTKVVLLREDDTINLETLKADRPYVPIETGALESYIEKVLSKMKYPYQLDENPNESQLIKDLEIASKRMGERMERIGIRTSFHIFINMFQKQFQIYPQFSQNLNPVASGLNRLECTMDERLLRRILDRTSHWNNAEIGAHISFVRNPNQYEPDLHTGLQFFHL